MLAKTRANNDRLLRTLFSGQKGKRYFGKHVVIIGGKATILPSDRKRATELIEKLEERHRGEVPQLLFVPRPETYILAHG